MLQKPASAIATEKMMGIDGPDVRHFKNLEEVQAAIDDGSITWVECTAAHAELGVVFSFDNGKVSSAHYENESVVVDRVG